MGDERKIRFHGKEVGPWSIGELYQQLMKGRFDHTAEFYSLSKNDWLPITGILNDLDERTSPESKVKEWKRLGMSKVEFLSGGDSGECPLCKAIAGKIYPIDEVPTIPPKGCTCKPWCGLCAIVTRENNR